MSTRGLRLAGAGDADAIARVHRLSRAWYYEQPADADDGREELWRRLLAEPGRRTHVATSGDSVVGFISVADRPRPHPHRELTALYVLPAVAGNGIGAALYDVFDRERPDGVECCLEVWGGNARALGFYAARGWRATGQVRPGPQGVDFLTFVLPG